MYWLLRHHSRGLLLRYACLYVAIAFRHCLGAVTWFCYIQTVNKWITNGEMWDVNHVTTPRQWWNTIAIKAGIINCATMGEHGSYSARGLLLFLTAQPWAEHCSCSAWWLFFSFVGDQTQTSSQPNFESCNLWCLFAKSCWNINTCTMVLILFSLLWCKI